MPIHDYQCPVCKHIMRDVPLRKGEPDMILCRKCAVVAIESGGKITVPQMAKMPARTAVRFKGEGWSNEGTKFPDAVEE